MISWIVFSGGVNKFNQNFKGHDDSYDILLVVFSINVSKLTHS